MWKADELQVEFAIAFFGEIDNPHPHYAPSFEFRRIQIKLPNYREAMDGCVYNHHNLRARAVVVSAMRVGEDQSGAPSRLICSSFRCKRRAPSVGRFASDSVC